LLRRKAGYERCWRLAVIAERWEPDLNLAVVALDREGVGREAVMTHLDLFVRQPWNRGRLIGPKPPLKPKHIWAIRQQLKTAGKVRDLALFNCAIDAKLRGCDLVKLRVNDVAPGGVLRARATMIQQKTGRPVHFELTEPAREALSAWLRRRGDRPDDWLFPSRKCLALT
jgi:integrase